MYFFGCSSSPEKKDFSSFFKRTILMDKINYYLVFKNTIDIKIIPSHQQFFILNPRIDYLKEKKMTPCNYPKLEVLNTLMSLQMVKIF